MPPAPNPPPRQWNYSGAAAPPPRQVSAAGSVPRPAFFQWLDQFWLRVSEGLELSQLWGQFKADARASYRFYQRDVNAHAPEQSQPRSFLHTVQQFAWAILEKLSPARRILLLAGVVLLLIPGGGFSYQGKNGSVEVVEFDLRFYGGALLFILLMLEVADRVVMKRDLEIARDIQQWLVPAHPPVVSGMQIAFAGRPANTVAGDFYDVFARPGSPPGEEKFLVVVADVAGKSIPAALLMATFQASLKTLSVIPCPLEELALGMNHYACTNSQDGRRFTTAFLGEFDPATRMFSYINAGHNPPLLQRATGVLERLEEGGLPLGILANAAYQSGQISLAPGDCLAIFTDGLIEAVNANDEEFGEHRVAGLLRNGGQANPDELLRKVMSELDLFVGATPQHDDVTCVLLKTV